jgi:Ca2+-binding RTX toxin-like protein
MKLVDASPTNKNVVSYEVSFNEAVSGVDGSDFTLVTSAGIKGATLLSVQPKGTDALTYTVSINTGSGDGTIQLTLKDNDSIKNALGVALGDSKGGTNGDFAGGAYTLLKFAPAVASINRRSFDPTAAGTVEYLVTFTQGVSGVDINDFSLAATGITGATILSVEEDDTSNYIVRVNTGSGNGTLQLNLVDDDSIKNAIDVPLGNVGARNGNFSGQQYTINKTPPKVLSLNRLNANPTNSSSVTFTAIFNENVNLVDANDFALLADGVTGARISSIKRVNGSFYEIEVDTGVGNGTIGLNLQDLDSIVNERGSFLGGTGIGNGNFTGEVYTIDKSNPTANIVNVAPDPRRDKVSTITIDFSEAVTGFDLGDLRLTRDGQSVSLGQASLTTNDNRSWMLSGIKKLTNSKGEYVLSLAAGDSGIIDVAGNPLTTNLTERWTNLETVDACDPGVFRRGTNADDVLVGTADKDTLQGSDGNDTLLGLDCGDRLVGDRGNDVLNGGEGNDGLMGGAGNDILIGGMGQDTLKGSGGKDRFVFAGASQAEALTTSRVDGPDRIQDFKFSQKDKFQLDFDNNLGSKNRPRGLFHAGKVGGNSLSAAVKAAYADKNQKTSGKQGLKANEAVFFKWKKYTYLSVNDNSSGFATDRDLVASVGIQFKSGDTTAGVLSVNNYFL